MATMKKPLTLHLLRGAWTATLITALAVILAGCPGSTMTDPEPPDTSPSFGSETVADQDYPVRMAITSVTLPGASGGNGDLSYTLTPIPLGLNFDDATRVLSGSPTTVATDELTYSVSDKDGDEASLTFMITVKHSKLFWTDYATDTIYSASLDGTGVMELVTIDGDAEPHGIALDVPGNMMYWVEHNTKKVRRANLDGTGEEDLFTIESNPRSIALDLGSGMMYWTSTDPGKISRANMDGTGEVEELVTEGLGYPTAIALDIENGKMYWADTKMDQIKRANLDGTGIEKLGPGGLDNPYGLALDTQNRRMYWTEQGSRVIRSADLDGTGPADLLIGQDEVDNPYEIALDVDGGKIVLGRRGYESRSERQSGRERYRRSRD